MNRLLLRGTGMPFLKGILTVHSALSPCGMSEETGVFTFGILREGLADMDYFYSSYSSSRAQS